MNAPLRSGFRSPYPGSHITGFRPGLRSGLAHRTGNWDHDRYRERYRGHDHDRHRGYGFNGFAFGNPGWIGYPYYPYPYPYVIDPGFYDWSDSSDSGNEQGYASPDGYATPDDGEAASDYGGLAPGYEEAPPYPNYAATPYAPQDTAPAQPAAQSVPRATPAGAVPAEPVEPLTVIFKDGRKSQQIRNYMLTATVLTNLDRQHYQQIPLDQIDVAATEQANRIHGIDFHVPPASRD
jgi:hypothetical protein